MKTTITPDIARHLLENNTKNRNVSNAHVKFLAKEIRAGNFVFNGESIIIADDGQLLDGQHRLLAIVEADMPIDVILVKDIPSNAMPTIDTGRARTAADVFHIENTKNATTLASGIRAIFEGVGKRNSHHRGLKTKGIKTSNTEIFNFYNEHEELMTSLVVFARHLYNTGAKILSTAEIIGYIYLLGKEEPNKIIDFFRELAYGVHLNESNCGHLLREKLINMKIAKHDDRKSRAELIIKSFRLYVNNEVRKQLTVQRGEFHSFMEDDIAIEPKLDIGRLKELSKEH